MVEKNEFITKTKAIEIIKAKDGTIRTAEAIENGIHPVTLYKLRDSGVLEKITRGIYRLAELGAISNPDLITIATRIPHAVICLTSALSFHDLTTQIPHEVTIAVKRDSRKPKIDFPPISIHQFSSASYKAGIEKYKIDGITVLIYSPEKTIADCFKFRNAIGMEAVLEALKLYRARRRVNISEILKYAKICRVEKIIKPYLEVTL